MSEKESTDKRNRECVEPVQDVSHSFPFKINSRPTHRIEDSVVSEICVGS